CPSGCSHPPKSFTPLIRWIASVLEFSRRPTRMNRLLTCALLACAALSSASAQTYVSAEPIPSPDIVGTANLTKILNLGYPNLELWSQRLLNDCHIVQNVINVLSENRAITTVNSANTRYKVAAGGFEAV